MPRSRTEPPPPSLRLSLQRPCALLVEEPSLKGLEVAEATRVDDLHVLLPGRVVLHAVGDHELDVGCVALLNHGAAFGARGRHRLFAEHMLADARGADGVLAMHAVGRPM